MLYCNKLECFSRFYPSLMLADKAKSLPLVLSNMWLKVIV